MYEKLIQTLKEILHYHQKIARFQRVKKDEWTLGSDSTVEIILDRVPPEEIEKAVEINVLAAAKARREYAKTIRNIMSNPENWHNDLGKVLE